MGLLQNRASPTTRDTIYNLLQECVRKKDMVVGRPVHSVMATVGLDSVSVLAEFLIHLYASNGNLNEVDSVFSKVSEPTPHTWHAIISSYIKHGAHAKALLIYHDMINQQTISPNRYIYLCVLKACFSSETVHEGMHIHSQIVKNGLESLDVVLVTVLVDMYGKCGKLMEAYSVFAHFMQPDAILFGALISGYVQHGQCLLALELFKEMEEKGLDPDRFSYSCALKACGKTKSLKQGREIHDRIVICVLESDQVICSTLIDMYVQTGNIEDACNVFHSIPVKDAVLWSTMIAGYVQHGNGLVALQLFEKMIKEKKCADKMIYSSAVKACGIIGGIEKGRVLHQSITMDSQEKEEEICNSLIDMYSKCGSLEDAEKVFQEMPIRSNVSYNTMIAAYSERGKCDLCIDLFQKMGENGACTDSISAATTLKACTDSRALRDGRLIHGYVSKIAMESHLMVHNTLIGMYATCGELDDAFNIFDSRNSPRDVVSWNVIIGGYAQHAHHRDALVLFSKMIRDSRTNADKITFSHILSVCADTGAMKEGFLVNSLILERNCDSEIVGGALINMYCKCGVLEEAERIFSKTPTKNAISWNSIIAGYAQEGSGFLALKRFVDMESQDAEADSVTFLALLKACGMIGAAAEGRWIHHRIIAYGCKTESEFLGNALIDMYVKCGSLEEALCAFDRLSKRDAASWNIVMGGYAGREKGSIALKLFHKMQQEKVEPDSVTFLRAIKVCASLKAAEESRRCHISAVELGLEQIATVSGALLDMYACLGSLEEAQKVFLDSPSPDIVSCNEMIASYADHGRAAPALTVFKGMEAGGMQPDKITFSSILRACRSAGALEEGRRIHGQIAGSAMRMDEAVGNALIDMYAKCGSVSEARRVFDEWPSRDVVMWGTMIAGYVSHARCMAALDLFSCMLQGRSNPDSAVFACVSKACGSIGIWARGKMVHHQIIEAGMESDTVVGTSLVGMYAKLGRLEDAAKAFFHSSPSCSCVASWSAMMAGYAKQGDYGEVQRCMHSIVRLSGPRPDEQACTSFLAGCSRAAQVSHGARHLRSMSESHGIAPRIEHLTCMIDLLGRAGRLDEAETLLNSVPSSMAIARWMSLLTACRTFGNSGLAKLCCGRLAALDPDGAAGYVADAEHLCG